MTRDEWLQQFEDELKKLRPHVGERLATTLALQAYDEKEHPRDMAREYHKRQQPLPPTPTSAQAKRKRSR